MSNKNLEKTDDQNRQNEAFVILPNGEDFESVLSNEIFSFLKCNLDSLPIMTKSGLAQDIVDLVKTHIKIDDGFGNIFPAYCKCGMKTQIVRPGKYQCEKCN